MWPAMIIFSPNNRNKLHRYLKYGETAYNLEPNVKNGPGGLRDLQFSYPYEAAFWSKKT